MALFIGNEIKIFNKIGSTNSYALHLIHHTNPPDGYVVWALEQQQGRGQRGNKWLAEPGTNLTFSIILQPRFLKISEQFQLNKAVSLGIAGFVANMLHGSSHVKIKWSNDIYVHDSKIAGILIENVLEGDIFKYSVVGIGLNVNQVNFDPSLPNPTSLKCESEQQFELDDCLKRLCSFIEKYYLLLKSANSKQIDDEYAQLLYKKGIWSNYSIDGERFNGKIEGVNKSGHLLITKNNGNNNKDEMVEISDGKRLGYFNSILND